MMRRLRWQTASPLLLLVLSAMPGLASEGNPALPMPSALKPQVEFWKKIFAKYSTYEVVVHDSRNLDRIYSILDFTALRDQDGWTDSELSSYINDRLREEKERVRAILVHLHEVGDDTSELTKEEKRLYSLFKGDAASARFLDAAGDDRLRGQRGLRERFADAIRISRRYLPEMESIFRGEGLPTELTRLPFVESCFNVKAYSKVGAAGIWQFMPSSGRRYMTINDNIDERRDPITATQAAARYLRADYEALGAWPLALTAYNHGRAGIQRAVDAVGTTDIATIISDYRGPSFGFASRNFYPEFLAAVEVDRHYKDYFGDLDLDRPVSTVTEPVLHHVHFRALADAADMGVDELSSLNPALSAAVVNGRHRVPKGYDLRLPTGAASAFRARYAALPTSEKLSAEPARFVKHRVKKGQSLGMIARQYGTSVAAIQQRNKIGRKGVRSGQILIIPRA